MFTKCVFIPFQNDSKKQNKKGKQTKTSQLLRRVAVPGGVVVVARVSGSVHDPAHVSIRSSPPHSICKQIRTKQLKLENNQLLPLIRRLILLVFLILRIRRPFDPPRSEQKARHQIPHPHERPKNKTEPRRAFFRVHLVTR